jgi:hypothetical protein
MEWLVLWLLMGGVVALVANSKGRDPVMWCLYGAAIWPIALTHALLLRNDAAPPRLAPYVDMAAMKEREKADALLKEGRPISDELAAERALRRLRAAERR